MIKTREYKAMQTIAHIVSILFTAAALIPFVLLIISSFSDNAWVNQHGFSFTPGKWSLSAYWYIGTRWDLIGR